jgi:hypothetical protein
VWYEFEMNSPGLLTLASDTGSARLRAMGATGLCWAATQAARRGGKGSQVG